MNANIFVLSVFVGIALGYAFGPLGFIVSVALGFLITDAQGSLKWPR